MSLPDWMHDAACAGMPLDVFFIEQGGEVETALEVCGRCPVRTPCGRFAEDQGIAAGVFGGLTPNQRKAARRAAG